MVKFISIFSLKPGYDSDETYQLWLKDHMPYVKRSMAAELRQYVIGRVVHTSHGGEFFGAVQLSFDTLADATATQNHILVASPPDEFMKRITNHRRTIIQEEDVSDSRSPTIGQEVGGSALKTICTLSLKSGYDPDETYQLWVKDHVPYVKQSTSGIRRYVVGRALPNSLTGKEIFGVVQFTYGNLEDAIKAGNRVWAHGPDEFMNRTAIVTRVIIREKDVMNDPI